MNVKQFYIDINGNYNDALAIMMNDMFVAKMLKKFMDNNAYEEILSLYKKKDYRALFAASHSLKGVAGNLALTPLYDIASTITEATRNSDDINLDNEMADFKKIYNLIKEKYLEHIA